MFAFLTTFCTEAFELFNKCVDDPDKALRLIAIIIALAVVVHIVQA